MIVSKFIANYNHFKKMFVYKIFLIIKIHTIVPNLWHFIEKKKKRIIRDFKYFLKYKLSKKLTLKKKKKKTICVKK